MLYYMKKYIISFLTGLAVLTCQGQGFLKAAGKNIVDGSGKPVILRGMGLGGWMLQEGYMLRVGNIGQQYKIREKIAALAGESVTDDFYRGWLGAQTTRADIDSMASWGFNSVRLPMHYGLYTLSEDKEPIAGQDTWLEEGFALTDSLLAWCKAAHLYLILDLHATPGGQGNDLPISDRDPLKASLWEGEANQKKMAALWKKLAARYAGESWIGGYDIINEPNWGFEDPMGDKRGTNEKTNAPLRALMMEVTKAIRSVDKKHIIIIEGNGFGNNYRGVLPPWDDNMVLSFHKYGNFNDEASIKGFLALRDQYNIPLWLGESGENSNTWYTECIRLVETHGIGWSWWPLKKMGFNNPLEIVVSPGYQRMLDCWNGKGVQPSAEDVQTTLRQLLRDVRTGQNIYHPDVVDAMFRQVYSDETRPWKRRVLKASAMEDIVIPAVEYDLGRQGAAYYDRDSASYQYTPGVKTVGNRGRMYRNDGVDITRDEAGNYYVFHTEDGEWLQYTVEVEKKGLYDLSFRTSGSGKLSLMVDGKRVPDGQAVALPAGVVKMRVYVDQGGCDYMSLVLRPRMK